MVQKDKSLNDLTKRLKEFLENQIQELESATTDIANNNAEFVAEITKVRANIISAVSKETDGGKLTGLNIKKDISLSDFMGDTGNLENLNFVLGLKHLNIKKNILNAIIKETQAGKLSGLDLDKTISLSDLLGESPNLNAVHALRWLRIKKTILKKVESAVKDVDVKIDNEVSLNDILGSTPEQDILTKARFFMIRQGLLKRISKAAKEFDPQQSVDEITGGFGLTSVFSNKPRIEENNLNTIGSSDAHLLELQGINKNLAKVHDHLTINTPDVADNIEDKKEQIKRNERRHDELIATLASVGGAQNKFLSGGGEGGEGGGLGFMDLLVADVVGDKIGDKMSKRGLLKGARGMFAGLTAKIVGLTTAIGGLAMGVATSPYTMIAATAAASYAGGRLLDNKLGITDKFAEAVTGGPDKTPKYEKNQKQAILKAGLDVNKPILNPVTKEVTGFEELNITKGKEGKYDLLPSHSRYDPKIHKKSTSAEEKFMPPAITAESQLPGSIVKSVVDDKDPKNIKAQETKQKQVDLIIAKRKAEDNLKSFEENAGSFKMEVVKGTDSFGKLDSFYDTEVKVYDDAKEQIKFKDLQTKMLTAKNEQHRAKQNMFKRAGRGINKDKKFTNLSEQRDFYVANGLAEKGETQLPIAESDYRLTKLLEDEATKQMAGDSVPQDSLVKGEVTPKDIKPSSDSVTTETVVGDKKEKSSVPQDLKKAKQIKEQFVKDMQMRQTAEDALTKFKSDKSKGEYTYAEDEYGKYRRVYADKKAQTEYTQLEDDRELYDPSSTAADNLAAALGHNNQEMAKFELMALLPKGTVEPKDFQDNILDDKISAAYVQEEYQAKVLELEAIGEFGPSMEKKRLQDTYMKYRGHSTDGTGRGSRVEKIHKLQFLTEEGEFDGKETFSDVDPKFRSVDGALHDYLVNEDSTPKNGQYVGTPGTFKGDQRSPEKIAESVHIETQKMNGQIPTPYTSNEISVPYKEQGEKVIVPTERMTGVAVDPEERAKKLLAKTNDEIAAFENSDKGEYTYAENEVGQYRRKYVDKNVQKSYADLIDRQSLYETLEYEDQQKVNARYIKEDYQRRAVSGEEYNSFDMNDLKYRYLRSMGYEGFDEYDNGTLQDLKYLNDKGVNVDGNFSSMDPEMQSIEGMMHTELMKGAEVPKPKVVATDTMTGKRVTTSPNGFKVTEGAAPDTMEMSESAMADISAEKRREYNQAFQKMSNDLSEDDKVKTGIGRIATPSDIQFDAPSAGNQIAMQQKANLDLASTSAGNTTSVIDASNKINNSSSSSSNITVAAPPHIDKTHDAFGKTALNW